MGIRITSFTKLYPFLEMAQVKIRKPKASERKNKFGEKWIFLQERGFIMKIKFGYHSGRVASECDQLKWSTKIDLWMCLLRHSKTVLGRNHSLASLYILYFHLCHLKNGWQTRPERRVRRQQSARPKRTGSRRPRIAPQGTPSLCDRKTPCTCRRDSKNETDRQKRQAQIKFRFLI